MSNISNIVIEDVAHGTDPEVTYTFTPNGFPAQDVSEYFERSGGIPIGMPRIRIMVRRGNANQDPRVQFQLDVPTLAATSPSTESGIAPNPTRAYNCIAKGEFALPRHSSAKERDILLQLFQGLANSDVITDAVVDLDFPY